MKNILLVVGFLFITSVCANAGDSFFEFSVGTGSQDISGDLQYQGTNLDLKDNLGLEKESQIIFNAKLEHPIPFLPNIYYRYIPSKFSGNKTTTTSYKYGGTTFDLGTTLKTELTMNRQDIGLYYNLPFLRTVTADTFDLEAGLNVRVISFKGSLEGTVSGVGGTKEEKSMTVPIPQLMGRFSFTPTEKLSINGELRWISASGNGLTDYTLEARFRPIKILYIGVGYFNESMTIDTEDVKANISINHPYILAGAEF